ncbi:hypothetical protein BMT54_04945 [Pasteurellaceae bacterium 15-036681]|nr:hypothetical protein BMT54_04945 [Pasteurellaceae bacterium 15-036681]
MFKSYRLLLIVFPIVTQVIFTLALSIFEGFNLEAAIGVGIFFTLPAFLLAVVCQFTQYHQRNLVQMMLMPAILGFIVTVISLPFFLIDTRADVSLIEESIMTLLRGLMIAGANAIYSALVLRLFLPKQKI